MRPTPLFPLLFLAALLFAPGCGDAESCGNLNCDAMPCMDFARGLKGPKLSCGCAPMYCCDTCEDDERCLMYCKERERD